MSSVFADVLHDGVVSHPPVSDRGVYVLRCEVGDTYGWYVGCSSRNIWERIREHCRNPSNDWCSEHTIVGIEVVFLEQTSQNVTHGSGPRMNETFVARRLIERYSIERVYGGGYSKKKRPANRSRNSTPTIGLLESLKGSNWEWLLDNAGGVRHPFYSVYSSIDGGEEIKYRIVEEPPLGQVSVSQKSKENVHIL